jgi:hypothetical protein
MGFEYSRWKCDNCGKTIYHVEGQKDFHIAQLSRFNIGNSRGHNPEPLPSYVRKLDEILCRECFEFHEKSWEINQRRNINCKNTENFISNFTP